MIASVREEWHLICVSLSESRMEFYQFVFCRFLRAWVVLGEGFGRLSALFLHALIFMGVYIGSLLIIVLSVHSHFLLSFSLILFCIF